MAAKQAEKHFVLEFIEVCRGLLTLRDLKCKYFSNLAKKGKQYEVLVEKYREKFPDADKQEVVKKINSLRTNFRKELKRIRDVEKSGAGAENVEPMLCYFEEMRFLQTQETPTASNSMMDISQDVIFADVVYDDEDCGDANETSSSTIKDGLFKNKAKARDSTEELVKLATERLQQPRDDCDTVAAAWAVELRKINPQQQLFRKMPSRKFYLRAKWGLYTVIRWKLTPHVCPPCVYLSTVSSPSLHSMTIIQQNATPKMQEPFSHLSNSQCIPTFLMLNKY